MRALAVCSLLLAACSDDGGETSSSTDASIGPVTSTEPTEGDISVAELVISDLPDGRYPARIVSISDTELTVDPVGFFTGAAAEREAAARGEDAPGAFYLADESPATETLRLAGHVLITSVWAEYETRQEVAPVAIELDELREIFDEPDAYPNMNIVADPFWLTVEGGEVVRMEEQYLS